MKKLVIFLIFPFLSEGMESEKLNKKERYGKRVWQVKADKVQKKGFLEKKRLPVFQDDLWDVRMEKERLEREDWAVTQEKERLEFEEYFEFISTLQHKLPEINTEVSPDSFQFDPFSNIKKIKKKEFCTEQVLIKNKQPKKKKKNESINSILASLQTAVINKNFTSFFTLLNKHYKKLNKEHIFSLSTLFVNDKENFLRFVAKSNLGLSKDDCTDFLHLLIEKKALPELIEWAVDSGANINALDTEGVLPIQRALISYDIFSCLLRFNPDLNILNRYGVSTFHEVLFAENTNTHNIDQQSIGSLASYLMEHYEANINQCLFLNKDEEKKIISPLAYAILSSLKPTISFILEKNGEFFYQEVKDKEISFCWENDDALHFVSRKSTPAIIELLVKTKKWDINRLNKRGRTPLHEAIIEKNRENTEKLIELGADRDIKIKILNHEYTVDELIAALFKNQFILFKSKN